MWWKSFQEPQYLWGLEDMTRDLDVFVVRLCCSYTRQDLRRFQHLLIGLFLGKLTSHEYQDIPDIGNKWHGTEGVV